MPRVTVILKSAEREALRVLAEREFRDPRAQAGLIIRRELERERLLPPELASTSAQPAEAPEPAAPAPAEATP